MIPRALSLLCLLGVLAPARAAMLEPAELAGMPSTARESLDGGQVVLLDAAVESGAYTVRCATFVAASPATILEAIRDYDALRRVFPEVRALSWQRGTERDRLDLAMVVHPLLAPIRLSKQVTWDVAENGDAQVDIQLVKSSARRVRAQDWTFHVVGLSPERSLVVCETRDAYAGVPNPGRLLARLENVTTRYVGNLRARCLLRGAGECAGQ